MQCNANPRKKKNKNKNKNKNIKKMVTKNFELKYKDHVRKTQLD